MTDVENCEILTIVEKFIISPHDRCKKLKSTLFCCQISWLAVYAVLPWNLFCRDLRAFCVEKNCSQKCAMWRKNDKYDVWIALCCVQSISTERPAHIAFDYLLWYCMVLQILHGVLQLIWRAGELRRSASCHFYCLSLNVFVVDMIIVTRECAESDLVQDFVTFHVFFDFEHIPEQVCSQWHYYNHCH